MLPFRTTHKARTITLHACSGTECVGEVMNGTCDFVRLCLSDKRHSQALQRHTHGQREEVRSMSLRCTAPFDQWRFYVGAREHSLPQIMPASPQFFKSVG